ncbi:DUF4160 domain-containing protein [Fibrella sp. WM1]|uniref:DUF4160 domain-containing protein n=1 Tax=Fibrella musci TaxID=3242485 RepID=UPI003522ED66
MPVFDLFDGIIISVFPRDHLPPHCHVQYAEHEALIAIRTLNVLAGWLPSKIVKKAVLYIGQDNNQQELLELFYQLNPQIKRL